MKGIGPVTNLTFSDDGGTMAAWGGGRELQLWDTQTSQPIGVPLKTNADMTAVAVSFDGHMVAAGSQDGVIKLWDTRDGTAHPQLAGENAKVTTLEFELHRHQTPLGEYQWHSAGMADRRTKTGCVVRETL